MHRLTLEIGGIAVGVEYDHGAYGAVLKDKYGGYVSDAAPGFVIRAHVVPKYLSGCGNLPDPAVQRPDGRYDLVWYDLKGVFDPAGRLAEVTISDTEYSINSVLRMLFSFYIRSLHGLLVHSASFIRGGQSYLFPGVSTAGKSTLSGFTVDTRPECEILTDEISLVRKIDGRWIAFGTPFWGDLKIGGRNISAPLKKICFIEKAEAHSAHPIDRQEAFRRFMQNALFLIKDRQSAQETMDLALEVVGEAETCVLKFKKDAGFWDVI